MNRAARARAIIESLEPQDLGFSNQEELLSSTFDVSSTDALFAIYPEPDCDMSGGPVVVTRQTETLLKRVLRGLVLLDPHRGPRSSHTLIGEGKDNLWAVTILRDALRTMPVHTTEKLNDLGCAYAWGLEFETALSYFEKAFSSDTPGSQEHKRLAIANWGKLEQAYPLWEKWNQNQRAVA